jgi:hypothetical protein
MPGLGADGTPERSRLSHEASTPRHEERSTASSDAPLLGADGTPSTTGAQRLIMSEGEGDATTPPPRESNRFVH